jgi:hypothetical protein
MDLVRHVHASVVLGFHLHLRQRRRRVRRQLLPLGLGLTVLALASCADLPEIAQNQCGNGVIEDGELCDSRAGEGLTCGAATDTESRRCRWICEAHSGCPDGWGCLDGLCQFSSGTFGEAEGSPYRSPAEGLQTADFDGDGRADLIGSHADTVGVLFGGEGGLFSDAVEIRTQDRLAAPAIADVTEDGLSDVLIPIAPGIFTVLGQADRTFLPVAYSPFEIDLEGRFGILLPLELHPNSVGDELLISAGSDLGITRQVVEADALTSVSLPGAHVATELVGRLPSAQLDTDRVAEFLLVFRGEDTIWLYSAELFPHTFLQNGVSVTVQLARPVLRQSIPLRDVGAVIGNGGARFADVNGDGQQDIMVQIRVAGRDEVAVALNGGNGVFVGADLDPLFHDMDRVEGGRALCGSQRWPLAVGDVNGDGFADFLGDSAMCLSNGTKLVPTSFNTDDPWVDGQIADFNGDGGADVAAVIGDTDGVDFLLGNGSGLFNHHHVDTEAPAVAMRVGDFDGDFVGDLAIVEDTRGQHTLAILYGSSQGPPSDPVTMGELRYVQSIEPTNFVVGLDTIDLTTDLLVQSGSGPQTPDITMAVMIGSSERRMLSPFSLQTERDNFDIPLGGVVAADFAGDEHVDLAAVAVSTAGELALWYIPGRAEGRFVVRDARRIVAEPEGFLPFCTSLAASDLDGDGDARPSVVSVDGLCHRFLATDGPRPPSHILVGRIADSTIVGTVQVLPGDGRSPSHALLDDLDADGRPDLAVSFVEGDQSLLILWNEGGVLSAGSPSEILAGAFTVPGIVQAFPPLATAVLRHGADGTRSLAVLTAAGIFLLDLDGRTLGAPRLVVTLPKGLIDDAAFAFGASLIAEDVDGDNLDDLIVGVEPYVYVYLAQPEAF